MKNLMTLVLAVLIAAAVTQAGVVYSEDFANPTNSDAAYSSVGWTALVTGESATDVTVFTVTSVVAVGRSPGNGGAKGYAYYAPKGDDTGTIGLGGPGFIFTGEADDVMLSDMEGMSFYERMDASATDVAQARFAIKMSGQWYVSEYQYQSTSEPSDWQKVSLGLNDWTNGANWYTLNVAVSETAGELSIGNAASGTLDGVITDFGVYAEKIGNAGDHYRVDDFEVSASKVVPEPATMALLGFGALGLIRRRK